MEIYTIIVIIFGIIALLALSIIFFINRTYIYKNHIEKSFEPIKEYLNERIEITKKMNTFIKNNLEHEKSLNKKLEKVIDSLNSITSASNGIPILKKTEETTDTFIHLEEIYKKLKDNKEYSQIKKEYQDNIDRINYAKDKYNDSITNYNNYKEKKLLVIINKILKFPEFTYYKNNNDI